MEQESRFNKYLRESSYPVRGLAIIAVVYIHFLRAYYQDFPDHHWYFTPGFWENIHYLVFTANRSVLSVAIHYFAYIAVSAFIILSGYGLALSSLRRPEVRWRDFLLKRAKRIVPLYYISIVFFVFFYLIYFYRIEDSSRILKHFLLKALFLHNYWSPGTMVSYNSSYWFVGTIVALYLCFPLLFTFMRKYPSRTLLASFLINFSVTFFIMYSPIQDRHPYLAMGGFPLGRLGEFALGVWVAVVADRFPRKFDRYACSRITPVVALASFALGLMGYSYEYLYPFHLLLLVVPLMLYFVYFYRFFHKPMRPLFAALGFVGVYSYSIYLFHRPFIELWMIYFELNVDLKYGLNLSDLGYASVYVILSVVVFSAVEWIYSLSVRSVKKMLAR